jgi:hypothetical protein
LFGWNFFALLGRRRLAQVCLAFFCGDPVNPNSQGTESVFSFVLVFGLRFFGDIERRMDELPEQFSGVLDSIEMHPIRG